MATWSALTKELDAWATAEREATLWWRDDDATQPTPALERLLDIAGANSVPVCLAVIPNDAQPGLEALAGSNANVAIVVHGVTHENFAAPGEKKCELVEERPLQMMGRQLAQGLETLVALAGDITLPVLVPPLESDRRDTDSPVAGTRLSRPFNLWRAAFKCADAGTLPSQLPRRPN